MTSRSHQMSERHSSTAMRDIAGGHTVSFETIKRETGYQAR